MLWRWKQAVLEVCFMCTIKDKSWSKLTDTDKTRPRRHTENRTLVFSGLKNLTICSQTIKWNACPVLFFSPNMALKLNLVSTVHRWSRGDAPVSRIQCVRKRHLKVVFYFDLLLLLMVPLICHCYLQQLFQVCWNYSNSHPTWMVFKLFFVWVLPLSNIRFRSAVKLCCSAHEPTKSGLTSEPLPSEEVCALYWFDADEMRHWKHPYKAAL